MLAPKRDVVTFLCYRGYRVQSRSKGPFFCKNMHTRARLTALNHGLDDSCMNWLVGLQAQNAPAARRKQTDVAHHDGSSLVEGLLKPFFALFDYGNMVTTTTLDGGDSRKRTRVKGGRLYRLVHETKYGRFDAGGGHFLHVDIYSRKWRKTKPSREQTNIDTRKKRVWLFCYVVDYEEQRTGDKKSVRCAFCDEKILGSSRGPDSGFDFARTPTV